MVGMVVMTLMMTADRVVAATFLDMKQLGYYALSIMVMRGLLMIPMVISKQLYPKMAETWGKTSNIVDLSNWIRIQVMMCLSLIIPLAVLTYFLFPLFINHFMSEYAPGITAMKITLIVPLFFGLAAVYANVLMIFAKQSRLMVLRTGAVLFNVIFNIVLIKLGYGINGIAAGTVAAYILYYLTVATAGKAVIRKRQYQKYFTPAKTARI
jgi:O-antigen/teichoic acid export membrane protein